MTMSEHLLEFKNPNETSMTLSIFYWEMDAKPANIVVEFHGAHGASGGIPFALEADEHNICIDDMITVLQFAKLKFQAAKD